ncbi:ABC-2 type transporter-domain-containing protein [Pisolithus tinctorius]|nr:ABC-2 type transporter-domain-containing protein [Pisolithus tinctorius]
MSPSPQEGSAVVEAPTLEAQAPSPSPAPSAVIVDEGGADEAQPGQDVENTPEPNTSSGAALDTSDVQVPPFVPLDIPDQASVPNSHELLVGQDVGEVSEPHSSSNSQKALDVPTPPVPSIVLNRCDTQEYEPNISSGALATSEMPARRVHMAEASKHTRTTSASMLHRRSGSRSILRPLSTATFTTIGDDKDFRLEEWMKDLFRRAEDDGLKSSELGVMFRDLRVVGVGASTALQPTVGSQFNPRSLLSIINNLRHPPLRDILSGFEGVVRPGEMLLVLGRPGSGCSTLLKTIANQRGEYHSIYGDVFYDSLTSKDIETRYRGDVIYCPEDDIHFPTLTVEETLSFAATMRAPHNRLEGQSRKEYVNMVTEVVMRVFGLGHARNTMIGNAAIRGISGGEKKRVSLAEALCCRSRISAWDNPTRGLDASTALELICTLRLATDISKCTTITSIYQAGQQLYDLFDKVCVIHEGRMVYFGPAKDAKQYFIDMGYEPFNRQTTADFLVGVTDPNTRKVREGFNGVPPKTAEEMAAYFKSSEFGERNRSDMESYYATYVNKPELREAYAVNARAEHARHAPDDKPYVISIPMQVRAVMRRRWQILKGDWLTQVVNLGGQIFQGLIMGTVYLRVSDSTSAFFSRGGVMFFALLFSTVAAMAEIDSLFAQRPIVLRQRNLAMYYPFIESLAHTIVDFPIALLCQLVFAVVFYFLVRLQQSAQQFFIFVLLTFAATMVMKTLFRGVSACFKTPSGAITIAGLVMVFGILCSGYVIPPSEIIGALRWITYINPIRYGFEALMVNEFHTIQGTCTTLVPQGPGYENISSANQVCTTVGSQPGQSTVDGNTFLYYAFGYKYDNLWRNFGIMCSFLLGFLIFLLIMTEKNVSYAITTSITLFKQGTNLLMSGRNDEEKCVQSMSSKLETPVIEAPNEKSALDPHVHPDIFSWNHIEYVVPVKGGERKLLDDVSGYVAPGKLTALVGESGAGKTTLLNVLAQRVSTGIILGDRFVNGRPLPANFQAQVGYCQQMDTHLPEATVREALLFSAKLRQPESVPLEEKEAYVDKCLKMVGLEAYANAIVGSLGVEHKKRTTIGVELAAKPKLLLFLDEPTSGLDSQSAWAIVKVLRELANHGQAILCTIHQPSGELFQMFDRLLLLRKGGQTVYFGDIGEMSSTLLGYFQRNGAPSCDPGANPAEYILDVIGAGATATSEIDWHAVWKASPEAAELASEIEQLHTEGQSRPVVETHVTHLCSRFATSWMTQFLMLTERGLVSYWRNPTYMMSKVVLNIAAGFIIGLVFFQANDTIQGTQNKLFAVFMASMCCVGLVQQMQSIYISVRQIYEIRERPSRMYSWTAFLTSHLIIELPWNVLGASLFFVSFYWTVGLATSRAAYYFLFFGVIFPIYYTTCGQAFAALAPTPTIATMLFSSLFVFTIIFDGVLQPFSQLKWWKWMYWTSPFSYLIDGLIGEAVGNMDINCSTTELVVIQPPSNMTCGDYMTTFISEVGGYLTNSSATSACNYCPYRTTDQYLGSNFNIMYQHRWRDVGVLLGFTGFNTVAIFVLTYLFRLRTKPFWPTKRK